MWVVTVGGKFWQSFAYEVSANECAWSLVASGVEEVKVEER